MVLLKVSSRSNPFSNESDPSRFLKDGEEKKACLLAEEELGFKVSILKSDLPLEKPLKGFLAGWNSIFLKTAEAEEDETAQDPLLAASIRQNLEESAISVKTRHTVLWFVGSEKTV